MAAVRAVSEEQWAAMDTTIAKAECLIHDREAAIAEAWAFLEWLRHRVKAVEQELVPVGVTAIEDTLRENVKETISVAFVSFHHA